MVDDSLPIQQESGKLILWFFNSKSFWVTDRLQDC